MKLRILGSDDVRRAVDMPTAIEAMRTAFAELGQGSAKVPERQAVPSRSGLTLVMPGYLAEAGALGAKLVSVFEGNRARGLPAVLGAVLLLDVDTGAPLALLDGAFLTALRTGAGAGLATSLLAPADASVLALFGTGVQAEAQLEAMLAVRPVREVRVVARTRRSALRFAERVAGERPELVVQVAAEPAAAVQGAQLIVTATTSPTPVVHGADVDVGCHVNGIGSFQPETREVDTELVRRARVVVDTRAGALAEAGDLLLPIAEGAIDAAHIETELGEIVSGRAPPGRGDHEISFFKSVGHAVQDLALAREAVEAAAARGLGSTVEL